MPNKQYVSGRRREYKLCNQLKKNGYNIVQRSAGSHSPIDIFAISHAKKIILFIQSKPDSMSDKEKKDLEDKHFWLNGEFTCKFEVI